MRCMLVSTMPGVTATTLMLGSSFARQAVTMFNAALVLVKTNEIQIAYAHVSIVREEEGPDEECKTSISSR